jgi:predicted amidohydrolase YtcJ
MARNASRNDGAEAECVLHHGRIRTIDPARPWAEAIAILGGRIVAVGDDDAIADLVGPGTRRVDLGGRMVLPGIVDVHNHHTRGGLAELFEINILPTMSFDRILEVVRARAAETPEDGWIHGGIWGSELVEYLHDPAAKTALDAASLGRPVMLRDDTQHSRFVNSRALEIIGVTETTVNPPDGEIVRDPATGTATGLLLEKASALAERAVGRSIGNPAERHLAATRRALQVLNSYGVTAFQDANTMRPFLEALATLDAEGGLSAWCVASLPAFDTSYGADIFGDALLAIRETFRSTHVRPDFVKLFMDGVPTTRTSAMLEPYIANAINGCCYRGDALISIPELARWIDKCERLGLSAKIHCTGDAAVRDTLDAIDVVRSFNGPRPLGPQHQIAHASFIAPSDIARFASLQVTADLSPIIWYPSPIVAAIQRVVPAPRSQHYWPNRDLHEAGVLCAAGSDWPVIPDPDPWLGIEGMVTRRNPKGGFPGALWPEQALDLATVLEIYTINAARALGIDSFTGSLEVGKSADLIVIDQHLFDIPPDDLADTKVLATYFEGRIVHGADPS